MQPVKFIFIFTLIGLVSFSGQYEKNLPGVSGTYEYLDIALDAEKETITGYFEDHTGWDEKIQAPRFSCEFFLYGKKEGNLYNLTTWYPGYKEFIKAELRFVKIKGILNAHLKLQERLEECDNVYIFDLEQGDYFEQDFAAEWIEIRMVSAQRAYFFTQPDPASRTKSYVIKNDIVQVFTKKKNWVLAQFSGEKLTKGWIREKDLFSIYPEN